MNNMTEDKFKLIGDKDIIELKGVAKQAKHKVQPAKDPKTNWYAGLDRLSDEDKRGLKFFTTPDSTVTLRDGMIFDLSNEIDAANWKWVRHCKAVAASLDDLLESPEAMFYVHIEGREAKKKNTRSEARFLAQKFVMEDSIDNYASRCLLLGMDFEGESAEVMKEYLLEQAIEKPESIVRIYTSKNLAIQLLYLTAKKQGKIREQNGALRYDLHVLGINDDTAIAYLQEPDSKGIVELLERDVNPQYFTAKKEKVAEVEVADNDESEEKEEPKKFGFQKKK